MPHSLSDPGKHYSKMLNMSVQHFWAAPMAAEFCDYHSEQDQNTPVKFHKIS